jgi:hypothetical protein
MILKELCDAQGGCVVGPDPEREGLEAPLQEVARVGVEDAAQMVQGELDFPYHLLGPCHHSGNDVGVAVHVLGRALENQVETNVRGSKIHRACEGVVDDGNQAPILRKGGHRLQVGQLDEGVGQSLHVDRPGIGLDQGSPGPGILGVNGCVADVQAREVLMEECVGPAVETVLHQEVIARGQDGEQDCRDGRHATSGGQRRFSAFHHGDPIGQDQMVGAVAQPHVPHVVIILTVVFVGA